MKFQPLSRMPMRPESEPGYDKEAWQPTWRCFCCHDTGFVITSLAAMVIEGYDFDKDKLPICQNTNCHTRPGETLLKSDALDWRLDAAICQELDRLEREAGNSWRHSLHELGKKALGIVEEFATAHSLRKRSRTPKEEMLAQQKHLAVLAEMNGHSLNSTS